MTIHTRLPHLLPLLLAALLLAACAPTGARLSDTMPPPGGQALNPALAAGESAAVAAATAEAARAQAQLTAQRATAQAQLATSAAAAATGEAEAVVRGTLQAQAATATHVATTATAVYGATSDALAFRATGVAIQATATAVAAQSVAEQRLIDDEMARLALQRQQEQAALAYRRQMDRIRPILWLLLGAAALLLAAAVAWTLLQRARPMVIPDPVHGPRVLIPAGSYQVLPNPPPRLALPAPDAEAPAADAQQPLPPLTSGHVLIAGETGSGKSTAMLAVLRRRSEVVVLDPHDDGRTWRGARVIGGGRDFDAIGGFMAQMGGLLSDRYRQRSLGQTDFEPLTVATDEMPAIVSALGREMEEVWRTWLREGRKVGLFFVVSTQSTRVKTLGIRGEGDLLENFTYVLLLGKVAAAEFPELVAGQQRPAILRAGAAARPVVVPFGQSVVPFGQSVVPYGQSAVPNGQAAVPNGQAHDGSDQPAGPALTSGEASGSGAILLPNGDGGRASGRFVAPTPRYADPTRLTPAVVARIREMRQQGQSLRSIETAVFGYNGGAAYQAVRRVLG